MAKHYYCAGSCHHVGGIEIKDGACQSGTCDMKGEKFVECNCANEEFHKQSK